jgi:hypothetical protein
MQHLADASLRAAAAETHSALIEELEGVTWPETLRQRRRRQVAAELAEDVAQSSCAKRVLDLADEVAVAVGERLYEDAGGGDDSAVVVEEDLAAER